jgi:hypothetical protein
MSLCFLCVKTFMYKFYDMDGQDGQRNTRHRVCRWAARRQGVGVGDAFDLETPGDGWVTLDRKLAAALTKISRGEFGR